MLQEKKINRINSFDGNSFNEKGGSVNITVKQTSKSTIVIYKYFKLIVVLEVLFVFVLGYYFLINPKIQQLLESREILKNKTLELETLKQYQVKSRDLETAYQKIKTAKTAELGELKNILPQERDLPELIAQTEALVMSQGLIPGNITINSSGKSRVQKQSQDGTEVTRESTETAQDDLIKEVEISLSVLGGDGTYLKVKKLLDAMEKHMRLIDITSFSFDEKMTSYSIIFKTYYLKNDE